MATATADAAAQAEIAAEIAEREAAVAAEIYPAVDVRLSSTVVTHFFETSCEKTKRWLSFSF